MKNAWVLEIWEKIGRKWCWVPMGIFSSEATAIKASRWERKRLIAERGPAAAFHVAHHKANMNAMLPKVS